MSETLAEDSIIEEQLSNEQADEEVPADAVEEPEDEVVVTIGDESPTPEEVEHAQAPAWVKELRKNHRELQKRNKELEEKLNAQIQPESKFELGAKPKLEDLDYDSDRFEEELSKWYERKRIADEQAAKAKAEQEAADKAWQEKLNSYNEAKSTLKVQDYEEAEFVTQDLLSKTQQGILLQGSENPALLVYALGKNPGKAKELAAIKDPVKYAFAIAKLETQLKITKRSVPTPEITVSTRGSARISGSVDSTLDRLREEAERTGDHSKVMAYRRNLRNNK